MAPGSSASTRFPIPRSHRRSSTTGAERTGLLTQVSAGGASERRDQKAATPRHAGLENRHPSFCPSDRDVYLRTEELVVPGTTNSTRSSLDPLPSHPAKPQRLIDLRSPNYQNGRRHHGCDKGGIEHRSR
jgi:hypothetical protein